jgi:cellulose synthase/poly-beta-1,6-N-acetylglucosamine synthase-like glycosyltransferase
MIIAYYALHYGSDYLGYSIKSIYDFVDEIHILYSDKPSHGHVSTLPNNDSKDKLCKSSLIFGDAKNKIKWHDGNWAYEGQQRDTIYKIAADRGADTILVVDADEIWTPEVIKSTLEEGSKSNSRNNLIRMLTFWRSFSWICTDEMMPVRLIYPNRPMSVKYLTGRVLHFGYARSIEDIKYKMSCHGHKNEWRADWFDRYCKWPASGHEDLHPTCVKTWNAQPYDKKLLPEFMHTHPYFNLDIIP